MIFKVPPLKEKQLKIFFHAEREKNTILFLKCKEDYRKTKQINAVYLSYRKSNGGTC